jgi:predicted MFS family arabinose efflux permease
LTRGRGPLAESYPAAVALVVCALVPFLMLSAAVFPLVPLISKSLGLSMPVLDVTIGLSDAAYAFGTVLAVQFAVHLPARRMLLGYVTAFVVAAVLAAWAPNGPVFAAAVLGRRRGGRACLALFLADVRGCARAGSRCAVGHRGRGTRWLRLRGGLLRCHEATERRPGA